MNPRFIDNEELSSPGKDSSFHVSHGFAPARNVSPPTFTQTSSTVRDEAALLLSIASICDREVKTSGFNAVFDDDFPKFPTLSGPQRGLLPRESAALQPRSEGLLSPMEDAHMQSEKPSFQAIRARSVSIDTSPALAGLAMDRTISPLPEESKPGAAPALVSPVTPHSVRQVPQRKQSNRRAKQARREPHDQEEKPTKVTHTTNSKDTKGKTLQASPPKGVPIKTIGRKKFSWKCYPELEQFLVVNRAEYLRHSALNYTVQQKTYNNRLTDQLLELATRHGYLFDTQEFSFVTVRDRIRCYYKSYVQSAKKRGVLMGYAARKAGLLREDDLVGNGGRIVTTL
mmetsp:Transcript_12202/g.26910  ORF Transcript_12202/g.26910 Transcript_12202/m.26910 type:complete len:342 (-) Transcript_12202:315-1340(-)